jgi:hypothetical protein
VTAACTADSNIVPSKELDCDSPEKSARFEENPEETDNVSSSGKFRRSREPNFEILSACHFFRPFSDGTQKWGKLSWGKNVTRKSKSGLR